MKEAMVLYGVSLGKRYSRRQKNRFFAMMKKQWEEDGYEVSLQSFESKLYRHYNIVIGDLQAASKVIVCGYDTPMKAMGRTTYYPFHSELNKQQAKHNLLQQIGCSLIYFLPIIAVLWRFDDMEMGIQLLCIILSGILLLFAYRRLRGQANPVNFNRNSASLALLATLMKEHHPSVAYVLLDQSIDSYEGVKLLKEYIHNQKVLYLDCIAYGEQMVIAHGDHMQKEAECLIQAVSSIPFIDRCYHKDRLAQNSISIIPNMLYIASGQIIEKEFVVKDTGSKADMQVDMERLELLQQGISTYLKGAL